MRIPPNDNLAAMEEIYPKVIEHLQMHRQEVLMAMDNNQKKQALKANWLLALCQPILSSANERIYRTTSPNGQRIGSI